MGALSLLSSLVLLAPARVEVSGCEAWLDAVALDRQLRLEWPEPPDGARVTLRCRPATGETRWELTLEATGRSRRDDTLSLPALSKENRVRVLALIITERGRALVTGAPLAGAPVGAQSSARAGPSSPTAIAPTEPGGAGSSASTAPGTAAAPPVRSALSGAAAPPAVASPTEPGSSASRPSPAEPATAAPSPLAPSGSPASVPTPVAPGTPAPPAEATPRTPLPPVPTLANRPLEPAPGASSPLRGALFTAHLGDEPPAPWRVGLGAASLSPLWLGPLRFGAQLRLQRGFFGASVSTSWGNRTVTSGTVSPFTVTVEPELTLGCVTARWWQVCGGARGVLGYGGIGASSALKGVVTTRVEGPMLGGAAQLGAALRLTSWLALEVEGMFGGTWAVFASSDGTPVAALGGAFAGGGIALTSAWGSP